MKNYSLIILLSVFIYSCNTSDDNFPDGNEYSQYITENSISTDIDFMSDEIYENSNVSHSPASKLKFITTQIFSCFNYGLVTTEFIKGSELIIRFEKILMPNICLTAFGPAVSYIHLPENINKLILINGETIDKYSIEIGNEQVLVSVIESNFTNSLYKKTFRYPENTFAYIGGTNINNTNLYDDFLELLLQNPSLTEYTFGEDGRIPFPESSDGHWVDNPSKYFKYNNTSDFEELGKLLSDFTSENIEPNSGVSISLISWDNKKHYSWID
jgi:hypothetical protein